MKIICLYTSHFPYGKGETFLENEIHILASEFDEVHIFPMGISAESRSVPSNVSVHYLFKGFNPNVGHKRLLIRNFFNVFYVFFHEVFKNRIFEKKYLDKIHYTLSIFGRVEILEDFLKKENIMRAVHYTYWFDIWASCFTFLNLKKKIRFISRAHRFDIYEELQKAGFLDYRNLQLKMVENVFSCSKDGQNYLQSKYPKYYDKIKVSYLGTTDYGAAVLPFQNRIRIVSCSNIVPVKRVSLLVDILKEVTLDVEWIHFGDGILSQEVKEKCDELPRNIQWNFMGRKLNKEVLKYYLEKRVDLFVNVSESEGLPVSIMEAVSFGIPVIATDVGGTSEIVCTQTGVLIEKDFTPKELAEIFESKIDEMKSDKFRLGVRQFWENNFNAKENYTKFTTELLKQK